ncbi:MAG TPA: carbohydrate ABC transporter permease [Caldilineae bacterium]|nr:carbohydrate ABC transporter permease [Caldilineae bacterium]
MRVRRIFVDTAVSFFILVGAFVMASPLLWMVITAFKSQEEARAIPLKLFPTVWRWQNFVEIWQVTPLGRALLNSFFIGGCVTAGVIITSTISGYAFAKLRFPGRDILFMVILSTMMVPFFLQAIPLFVIMARLGWINSYQALIVPGLCSAFGIFVMRQFMLTIPTDLIDAARIDGCSEFGILWRIMLPLIKSAAAALGIFTFVFSWQDLFWPLLVAKKPDYFPAQLAVYYIQGQYGDYTSLLMAAGTVTILPSLIMFLILQERMVKGVALTGLKG